LSAPLTCGGDELSACPFGAVIGFSFGREKSQHCG
jgi:hypothetical protein